MEPVPEDMGGFSEQIELNENQRQALLGEQNVAVISRVYDVTIRWFVVLAIMAANGLLLTFALPRVVYGELIGLWMGLTVFVLTYLWRLFEDRMYILIEYWNDKLIAISDLFRPRVRVYGGPDWEKRVRGTRPTTRTILLYTIYFFGILGLLTIALFAAVSIKPDLFPPPPSPPGIERRLEHLEQRMDKIEQLDKRMEKIEKAVNQLKPARPTVSRKPRKGQRK